jgi:hypothetical protein
MEGGGESVLGFRGRPQPLRGWAGSSGGRLARCSDSRCDDLRRGSVALSCWRDVLESDVWLLMWV